MAETKSSTGGLRSASQRRSARLRLGAVMTVAIAAVALAVWIRSVTWQRVAQLENEFAAIRSERFLLGLHARESVVRMNAALLRYQLSGDVDEQQAFQRIGRELTNRFERTFPALGTEWERATASAFKESMQHYFAETADMIARPTRPVRKETSSQVHDVIVSKSQELLRLSEQLVAAQQAAWVNFFGGSARALTSLRTMLWVSFGLLVLFAALLALLAYGTFVAPLRAMLTQSQAVLERHEKLASLGTLAAGVAHEIRNPLQAIKMRLFSLKKSLPGPARDHEDLAVISSEINRLEKIVKDTLQFARPGEPEMTTVPVAGLVHDVADLLAASLQKRGVELRVESAADAVIRADRQQLQQVFINLILNGAESMDGAGAVTLRAHEDVAKLNGAPEPVVRFEVTDTGRGISPDAERRIFDPFFSTKEGGTGLGLSIAARIVEKHGGFIHYSTQPGHGTTFTVVLPRQKE